MFFRSGDNIDAWCSARQTTRGEVLSIAQLWELSQRWYHNRLCPDFHGRTAAEVAAIFQALGLTSAFWQLEGDPHALQK